MLRRILPRSPLNPLRQPPSPTLRAPTLIPPPCAFPRNFVSGPSSRPEAECRAVPHVGTCTRTAVRRAVVDGMTAEKSASALMNTYTSPNLIPNLLIYSLRHSLVFEENLQASNEDRQRQSAAMSGLAGSVQVSAPLGRRFGPSDITSRAPGGFGFNLRSVQTRLRTPEAVFVNTAASVMQRRLCSALGFSAFSFRSRSQVEWPSSL
jgi:hypothetical protein